MNGLRVWINMQKCFNHSMGLIIMISKDDRTLEEVGVEYAVSIPLEELRFEVSWKQLCWMSVNISLTKFCNWDIRLWKNYSVITTRAFLSRTCKLSSALALRLCFWLINITSRRRRSSKTMNLLDQVTSSTIRCRSRFDETLDQWSMLSFPKIRWWCEGF